MDGWERRAEMGQPVRGSRSRQLFSWGAGLLEECGVDDRGSHSIVVCCGQRGRTLSAALRLVIFEEVVDDGGNDPRKDQPAL